MIDGYGKIGMPNEALELFHSMQQCRIEPNYVTFLGSLSACAHAGLVAKGREIFESMERDYSLKPGMEHYACMVDLLGRAGNLQLAWEFVAGMPEKPNSDVWAALLSSCNLHGNVEMASIAANELFKLNAEGRPGAYVALSNTLAAAGKWDGVSELREIMKSRGILKDTGSSWIGTESCSARLQRFYRRILDEDPKKSPSSDNRTVDLHDLGPGAQDFKLISLIGYRGNLKSKELHEI
ncbi:hypothetical protein GH714_000912 [Hevea brasiliensis]|uniref:Pentacotripeptide-repeat region of PRORP domain-containing protein n=1 Tax=Hevea brasiliensis TaxID=3981 RepID=A0A6A6LMN1_HEVBR|nr:hypothetical protein GH714_000912 [Hevea brasiliensis]